MGVGCVGGGRTGTGCGSMYFGSWVVGRGNGSGEGGVKGNMRLVGERRRDKVDGEGLESVIT